MKWWVLAFAIAIFASLVIGLFFLLKDPSGRTRTVRSLTLRIIISLTLFFSLFLGFRYGLIHPHGLGFLSIS